MSDDDDPRLPTRKQAAQWAYEWNQGDGPMRQRVAVAEYVAREAAKHALAQVPSLTNAEKREVWHECAGWCYGVHQHSLRETLSIGDARYPDPVPAPTEYTLHGNDYRKHADGTVERLYSHGWQMIEDGARVTLKALAEGLA